MMSEKEDRTDQEIDPIDEIEQIDKAPFTGGIDSTEAQIRISEKLINDKKPSLEKYRQENSKFIDHYSDCLREVEGFERQFLLYGILERIDIHVNQIHRLHLPKVPLEKLDIIKHWFLILDMHVNFGKIMMMNSGLAKRPIDDPRSDNWNPTPSRGALFLFVLQHHSTKDVKKKSRAIWKSILDLNKGGSLSIEHLEFLSTKIKQEQYNRKPLGKSDFSHIRGFIKELKDYNENQYSEEEIKHPEKYDPQSHVRERIEASTGREYVNLVRRFLKKKTLRENLSKLTLEGIDSYDTVLSPSEYLVEKNLINNLNSIIKKGILDHRDLNRYFGDYFFPLDKISRFIDWLIYRIKFGGDSTGFVLPQLKLEFWDRNLRHFSQEKNDAQNAQKLH